ncbi:MAG: ornithine cyclodeaminase family protein, partial [Rhodospirillales bacterium]
YGWSEDTAPAADIVVTTTPATSPLVESRDMKVGQHITAMGSDADYKNELAPRIITDASLYVCDSHAQCLRQGELRAAVAAGAVSSDHPYQELGSIIAGKTPGRRSAGDITVCDLTGTGIQDTAIAAFTLQQGQTFTLGHIFNSD